MIDCIKNFKILCLFLLISCSFILFSCNHSSTIHNTQNIPEAYYNLIYGDYKNLIEAIFSDDYEDYINTTIPSEWFNMAIDAPKGIKKPTKSSYGYSLKDINSDGINELILMREDYFILAIYTLDNDNLVMIDAFSYKYKGMLLNDGNIYTISSGGYDSFEHRVNTLPKYGNCMLAKQKFGHNHDYGYYIEQSNGERKSLDENDYLELISSYPDLDHINTKQYLMKYGVVFIPIFE